MKYEARGIQAGPGWLNFPKLGELHFKFPDIALDVMFAAHDISRDLLFLLSMENLKEFVIQSVGVRMKLLSGESQLSMPWVRSAAMELQNPSRPPPPSPSRVSCSSYILPAAKRSWDTQSLKS